MWVDRRRLSGRSGFLAGFPLGYLLVIDPVGADCVLVLVSVADRYPGG